MAKQRKPELNKHTITKTNKKHKEMNIKKNGKEKENELEHYTSKLKTP